MCSTARDPVFLGPFDSFLFPCDLHLEWLLAYVSLSCEHMSGGKPWEGLSQKLLTVSELLGSCAEADAWSPALIPAPWSCGWLK